MPDWNLTSWQNLVQVGGRKSPYLTRAKILYSATGTYFFVECEDKIINCTYKQNLAPLFQEDVVEIFLQPNASQPIYFEYEISPLGFELPLLIVNNQGQFKGWQPWSNSSKIIKQTKIIDTDKGKFWTLEIFIPFSFLTGLSNNPPKSGDIWKGNINRIDYDRLPRAKWALFPKVKGKFHDYRHFGIFSFE